MTDIVNLRLARKRKARAGREAEAAENRLLHGRSRAAKEHQETLEEKGRAFIEGHRREKPASPG